MARILAARASKSVSSPHGLTSQTMIDLAIGPGFFFAAAAASPFAFNASAAAASAVGSSANGSNSSSTGAAALATIFLATTGAGMTASPVHFDWTSGLNLLTRQYHAKVLGCDSALGGVALISSYATRSAALSFCPPSH